MNRIDVYAIIFPTTPASQLLPSPLLIPAPDWLEEQRTLITRHLSFQRISHFPTRAQKRNYAHNTIVSSNQLSPTQHSLAYPDSMPRAQEGKDLPLRSVDTPVANNPLEATANEPPRSVMQASVPPWRIFRRFYMSTLSVCLELRPHVLAHRRTVWCFSISSSKFTTPGFAAVMRSCGCV